MAGVIPRLPLGLLVLLDVEDDVLSIATLRADREGVGRGESWDLRDEDHTRVGTLLDEEGDGTVGAYSAKLVGSLLEGLVLSLGGSPDGVRPTHPLLDGVLPLGGGVGSDGTTILDSDAL